MAQLIENKWNPVNLRNKSGGDTGYAISNYAVSTSWYNKILDGSGVRRTRLSNFYEADKASVEISRALDIIAEDISSSNADDKDIFDLKFAEDSNHKKTTILLLNAALDMWADRTKMERDLFVRIRKTLVMGSTFYKINPDGSLKELPTERFVGYIVSEDDEDVVTHYIYDPKLPRIDKGGRTFKNAPNLVLAKKRVEDYETISVDDLLILKVGCGPFGTSIIESIYGVWKQMALLEAAIVIYRVVRAPERRVYYIDTGKLQGPKRKQAIDEQRLRLMQKQANKSGQITTEYDPHSTGEDIFIPTNSDGKGSRIETLPGGQNLDQIADLNWFSRKLAAGLRVPSSMLDATAEQTTMYTDMRVGQYYQIEMRYMGHITRIQKLFEEAFNKNFVAFCGGRGIAPPQDCRLIINESMSFNQYKDMEVNQQALNVLGSTLGMPQIAKKFAMQKYLGLDEESMTLNEEMKLLELGIPKEEMLKMEPEVISNILYGNGRLGEKYGLAPPEGEETAQTA